MRPPPLVALSLSLSLCAAAILAPRTAAADDPPRYRNPSMRIAGIVLVSIASAALASGLVVIALDRAVWSSASSGCEDSCGIPTFIIGLPLVSAGMLFAGIGVPLWVVGARPPAAYAGVPAWLPTVAPSRNGAGLRWTF